MIWKNSFACEQTNKMISEIILKVIQYFSTKRKNFFHQIFKKQTHLISKVIETKNKTGLVARLEFQRNTDPSIGDLQTLNHKWMDQRVQRAKSDHFYLHLILRMFCRARWFRWDLLKILLCMRLYLIILKK